MKNIWHFFFGVGRGKILDKMVRLVLADSFLTVLILGGIAFYGMNSALYRAEEMGESLGETSYRNSSALLIKQRQEELVHITQDNAVIINHTMEDIAYVVEGIARQAEEIERNPGLFLPRMVNVPSEENYRGGSLYLQYGTEYFPENLRPQIFLMANMGDLLSRVAEKNEMADSVFIAAKENFTLSVDKKDLLGRANIPGVRYNALGTDWYKSAAEQDKLVFTNVRKFLFSQQPGLFCAAPYHGQNGELLGVAGLQMSLSDLRQILQAVNLYEGGFCFITDNRGYVILSSSDKAYNNDGNSELAININNDLRNSPNVTLAAAVREMTSGQSGLRQITIDGGEYYIAYTPIESTGWSFAAAFDVDYVVAPALQNKTNIEQVTEKKLTGLKTQITRTMLFMGAILLLLLAVVIYTSRRLSARFLAPIHRLTDGVREIAAGNLSRKVKIQTGDEIENLANCFNDMTDELQTYMKNLTAATAEKERIATELSVARNIQRDALPKDFLTDNPSFGIYAAMTAAKEVGGDFYDFYLRDENHLVVTIADVSGKGVPAALYMMRARTILKSLVLRAPHDIDFAEVMTLANRELCQDNEEMMFVTVFIAQLELDTGKLTYVNGGHNPPLIRQEGKFSYIKLQKPHNILGANEFARYAAHDLALQPKDMLFLYTDGVTEAMDTDGNQYTEKRLLSTLEKLEADISLQEMLSAVKDDITVHVNGAAQSDDITMLGLQFLGKQESVRSE